MCDSATSSSSKTQTFRSGLPASSLPHLRGAAEGECVPDGWGQGDESDASGTDWRTDQTWWGKQNRFAVARSGRGRFALSCVRRTQFSPRELSGFRGVKYFPFGRVAVRVMPDDGAGSTTLGPLPKMTGAAPFRRQRVRWKEGRSRVPHHFVFHQAECRYGTLGVTVRTVGVPMLFSSSHRVPFLSKAMAPGNVRSSTTAVHWPVSTSQRLMVPPFGLPNAVAANQPFSSYSTTYK